MPFYKIRPRAGTKLQWEQANTVLGEREIGFEIPVAGVGKGEVKMKMGDGVTAWNDLPYGINIADFIEPTLESNSDKNVPTIKAVNDGLSARQLLVNNDFQINQRGETEYIQDVNDSKYYIDMWKLYTEINTTAKITKLKKGIKIESTGEESQLFQLIHSTNENVACSIKINSISGNVDFAIYNDSDGWINKVTNLKVGVSSFIAEGKKTERVGIRCHGTCVLEIEYIDLFEGDIVYPHVKKKYSEDLMECQRYLVVYKGKEKERTVGIAYTTSNTESYALITLPTSMANIPTVTKTGNWSIAGIAGITEIKEVLLNSNVMTIKMVNSNSQGQIIRPLTMASGSTMVISCE